MDGCISAVGWVPKGSARPDPKKYVPTEEEMAMMQAEAEAEMADGTVFFSFFLPPCLESCLFVSLNWLFFYFSFPSFVL